MLKNWKLQEVGGAVTLLICGLVLLLMPELTLVTIANVIGIFVIVIGAFFLVSYFMRKELAAGNNDFYTDLPGQAVIDLDGYRVFITHGHGYHVSYSPNRLVAEALHRNAQIAMYGHTHVPHLEQVEGVIVLNPGSLSYPRQAGREPSYIIMETTPDKQVHFDIRYLRK